MNQFMGDNLKLFLGILIFISSASSMAANLILQYSWQNQEGASFLLVFDDGSILHQEKSHYSNKTIPQQKLSALEVKLLQEMLNQTKDERVFSAPVELNHKAEQGALLLRTSQGMKLVEGIVRDSVEPQNGLIYRMDTENLGAIKQFIFNYTDLDMNL